MGSEGSTLKESIQATINIHVEGTSREWEEEWEGGERIKK